jgi:predicted CoA-binding protein
VQSPTDPELREIFTRTRTIAVLGAHTDPVKPAHYVPDYLHGVGYTIYAVNPLFAGRTLWGRPAVATLPDLPEPVDLVDVFRRPEHLPDHIPEILAMQPRPPLVWLQLGISHAEFARTLRDAGIKVIEDRCTLAEHRRLGLGTRP